MIVGFRWWNQTINAFGDVHQEKWVYEGNTDFIRCFIKKAMRVMDSVLNSHEKRLVEEHLQFKHFFHMHKERKYKVIGTWMVFLHTTCTSKVKDAWFIVPIRFSIREHKIISRFYCHNYPLGCERMDGLEFIGRHFKIGSTITYKQIEKKFLSMKPCEDRLNMVVLYFLSSVIIGKIKTGKGPPSVESFFLEVTNDLELCWTFPWVRLSLITIWH